MTPTMKKTSFVPDNHTCLSSCNAIYLNTISIWTSYHSITFFSRFLIARERQTETERRGERVAMNSRGVYSLVHDANHTHHRTRRNDWTGSFVRHTSHVVQ